MPQNAIREDAGKNYPASAETDQAPMAKIAKIKTSKTNYCVIAGIALCFSLGMMAPARDPKQGFY